MARRTRSGNEFSPYVALATTSASTAIATIHDNTHRVLNTGKTVEELGQLLQDALVIEHDRGLMDADDTEGKPLSYTPPVGSPLSSPLSSPPDSPLQPPYKLGDSLPALELPPKATATSPACLSHQSPPPVSPNDAEKASSKKRRRRKRDNKRVDGEHPAVSTHPAYPAVSTPSSSTSHQAKHAAGAHDGPNHAQRGYYARRALQRAVATAQPADPAHYKIRSSLSRKALGLDNVKTTFDLAKLSWAKGAFIGRREKIVETLPSLDKLLRDGFKVLEWDGW